MLVYAKIRREWRCPSGSRYQANLLRGIFLRSYDVKNDELPNYSGPCPVQGDGSNISSISQGDVDGAKGRMLISMQNDASLTEPWLDVDTFKLTSTDDEIRKATAVTLADVKAISERLYKAPAAKVLLTPPVKTN